MKPHSRYPYSLLTKTIFREEKCRHRRALAGWEKVEPEIRPCLALEGCLRAADNCRRMAVIKTWRANAMKEFQTILNEIESNTQTLNYDNARRVLVLYEEKIVYIGDCCIRFDKLKYFKSFLRNATVSVNFSVKENSKFYNAFLTNNPHI